MTTARRLMARASLAVFMACGLAQVASASQLFGLLRVRDLSLFGFLRLDMRPAYATSIEPGVLAGDVVRAAPRHGYD